MAEIALTHVTKEFGSGVLAVDDISLTIVSGEFLVLVGPSGCGKSTLLRMIAGLEEATDGTIEIDGRDVTFLPPRARDVAMVFQNYALYPHMTVRQNLGYGLKVRKTRKDEVARRVDAVAEMLGLEAFLDRRPAALSGGQRQRVAMGRAIVREPKAFLMDEPLSNLDAKLRVTIRAQLSALHQRLRATTVYVTHDQVEAMTLGHRVAVMRDGRILQIGTPQELYQRPQTLFVAAFIGSPAMNLVEADVADGVLALGEARIPLAGRVPEGADHVVVGIRPEAFEDASLAERALPELEVAVDVVEEIGPDTHVIFGLDAKPVDAGEVLEATGEDEALLQEDRVRITARVDPRTRARAGSPFRVCVDPAQFHFFDAETGRRLVATDALVTSSPR